MPRYFFHTQVGDDLIADPTGVELRDPDAAWVAGRDIILAAMAEAQDQSKLMASILVVTDAAAEVVLEFPFSEALPLPSADDAKAH